MNNVVKMLALSLISGALMISSVNAHAELSSNIEQGADELNLHDGSADNWLEGRGRFAGLAYPLYSAIYSAIGPGYPSYLGYYLVCGLNSGCGFGNGFGNGLGYGLGYGLGW